MRWPAAEWSTSYAARVLAAIAGIAICWTCNYGEVTVVSPAPHGPGTLTLSVQVDPEDTAVARKLGWGGHIPAAEVTVTAGGGDTAVGPPVATVQTDSAGMVSVPDLPDGSYFVQVRRLLTATEAAQLAPTDDVIGFMGQAVVARGGVTVSIPASRRRSVVISEWAFQPQWIPAVSAWYYFGGFLELANNADTTVYLDGLVIGEGFIQAFDLPSPHTCAEAESYSNDPNGIWARFFDSIPGTGHTHPLAPGAVAVIATDAIDHSAVVPGGLDLSHADFDFVGTSDVVNPTVPNTISLGPEDYLFGHGLFLNEELAEVVFVAMPVDTSGLPKQWTAIQGNEYERMPRARVLDAIALLSPHQYTTSPLCPHLVHSNFDRYRGGFAPIGAFTLGGNPEGLYSVQRKVAYTRADRRKILQHTRTTDADFFYGLRTPFQLP